MKSMRQAFPMLLGFLLCPAWAAQTQEALKAGGPSQSTSSSTEGRIRTQITARNAVTISSELAAKISTLAVRDGDSFRAGQTLVSFDCSLYRAQLNKALAGVEGAKQNLDVNKRLAELHSAGTVEVNQAATKLKELNAEVNYAQTTTRKCSISAPFSGRVAKRIAAAHQYVTPGTPLLEILDTSQLELEMIVPSKWLGWIKSGVPFMVQVEELGKSYPAHVTKLGARIDPVSQSLPIHGVLDRTPPELLSGMSGWAQFSVPK